MAARVGGRARPRGPARAVLLGIALSACLSACGIETVSTLEAPSQFIATGGNQIILMHNTGNNASSLKGYEVYYRAFDSLTAADTARNAIQTTASSASATPESCLASMQAAGFSRIFDAQGNDGPNGIRPLFTIAASEQGSLIEYVIWLDFYGTLPSTAHDASGNLVANAATVPYWYYTRSTLAANYQVAITRSISISNSPVSFESTYRLNTTTDQSYDYLGAGAVSKSPMYFVFFAVAYGINTSSSSFVPVYSLPVSLYTSLPYILP